MDLGEKEREYFQMLLGSKKTRIRQKLKQQWQILFRNYYNMGKRELGIELAPIWIEHGQVEIYSQGIGGGQWVENYQQKTSRIGKVMAKLTLGVLLKAGTEEERILLPLPLSVFGQGPCNKRQRKTNRCIHMYTSCIHGRYPGKKMSNSLRWLSIQN